MTGYKSKQAMSAGAFYAPYIHVTFPKLTWRDQLHTVYLKAVTKYSKTQWDDIISDCMDFMQRTYPGRYHTLHWINGGLVPVFLNDKHKMMWYIQYGSE